LCLTRREARLYEGNRDALDAVGLTDVPATLTEALGDELTEPHLTVASYGLGAGEGSRAMRHGHGSRADKVNIDRERFFHATDRAILEHHSRLSGLPLMLAALPEYHTPFRAMSHNPFLLAEGIQTNPESLSEEQLRREAWQTMAPLYLERLAQLVEAYQVGRSRQLASDDVTDVARAAAAGRVATLLVEADRTRPGRIDAATGAVEPGDLSHPETDDMLDDLAEIVLRQQGQVVVVPAERMPSATGLAAMYRY
jgi:hypothetical protein